MQDTEPKMRYGHARQPAWCKYLRKIARVSLRQGNHALKWVKKVYDIDMIEKA